MSPAEPTSPGGGRRGVVLLLFLTILNVLNFVDRQLIASLAPMLIADLQLTRAQIGLLVGFAFVFFYSLVGMALGALADRVSRPRLIATGLALWSLMTAVSGAAKSFVHLAIPRMFVGVGEATLTPAALSMLAATLPASRLGLATGIYYAGLPVGTALSMIVAGWVAPRFGWRACFYVLGSVGLVFTAVLLFFRDPRETGDDHLYHGGQPGRAARRDATGLGDIARTLARMVVTVPSYSLAILAGSLLAYGSAAALHGMTWLVQERHFAFATAAYTAGVIAVVSGLVGNLVSGWFADVCQRRWRAGRLWSLVISTMACTPFAVTYYLAPAGSVAFFVGWFVAAAASTAYFGPVFAIIQSVSPVRIRATAVALALLGMNLLGVGPGPWITGMIGDASSLTRGLLTSVAVALTSVIPLSIAALRYERDVARATTL